MEDETFEPVEREAKKEELEELPPKKKGRMKIIAIALAAILAGVGVWYFVFSNSPPSPAFTAESDDLLLSVDASGSTDPDGNIASYSWNWGDPGSPAAGSGVSAQHTYSQQGSYDVTLTVTDARGAARSLAKSVVIQILPVAAFVARHDRMTVSFDASTSFSRAQGVQIVSYQWDFGDGASGTGVSTTHTYASAGRRIVTLDVTDSLGRVGNTTRFVSPADTTVDVLLDDFFSAGCPYGDYWPLRFGSYGDVVLKNSVPCTDFYPWVLITAKDPVTGRTLGDVNPSYVYSLYRMDARVRNHPAYNLYDPVMLPVFNNSVAPDPASYIQLNLTFDYLGSTLLNQFSSGAFAVDQGLSDGFGYLVRGNITMDLTTSQRVFGVNATTPAEAQSWWWANTRYGSTPGPLESTMGRWLSNLGNGKYDVFNAFEFYYQSDIADFNATVASDGTTRVQVFWDGWGFDVLLARWFYWGNASYLDAVCTQGNNTVFARCDHPTLPYGAVQPKGWLPMEECFCESSTIDARITRTSMDLDYDTILEYVFQAIGNPGSDGLYGTSDDLPTWSFDPVLMDYVPREGSGSVGSEGYPNSELRWYEGMTTPIVMVGSYSYGRQYEYTNTPVRWRFDPGSSLTIILPQFEVPWYDPVRSKWNPTTLLGDYVTFNSTMTLRLVKVDGREIGPGALYLWDHRAKVLSMAGPYTYTSTGLPLSASPHIEFRPETSG